VLKIGVVGTGDVARKLYLPGIHNPDAGVVLQAVCDIVRERAEVAAKDFGAQKVYTDVAEMLEREDLDLVFVLTPLLTHQPIVRQVLQSGKNCYSEKPLTLSRREADELAELAERKQGVAPLRPYLSAPSNRSIHPRTDCQWGVGQSCIRSRTQQPWRSRKGNIPH
jgi:predicted dehydrogenase